MQLSLFHNSHWSAYFNLYYTYFVEINPVLLAMFVTAKTHISYFIIFNAYLTKLIGIRPVYYSLNVFVFVRTRKSSEHGNCSWGVDRFRDVIDLASQKSLCLTHKKHNSHSFPDSNFWPQSARISVIALLNMRK